MYLTAQLSSLPILAPVDMSIHNQCHTSATELSKFSLFGAVSTLDGRVFIRSMSIRRVDAIT